MAVREAVFFEETRNPGHRNIEMQICLDDDRGNIDMLRISKIAGFRGMDYEMGYMEKPIYHRKPTPVGLENENSRLTCLRNRSCQI